MVISPNDFSLWARLTGNKYPSTPKERAQKGPEVHNFIQNLDKEGMIGGKEVKETKKEKNLGEKLATGALIAGGVAAAVAAGRDKRVQDIAQRTAANTQDKIGEFLSNLGGPRVIDKDIVDASYDVTPEPSEQQSNTAPTQNTDVDVSGRKVSPELAATIDRFTPVVEGKIYKTEGSIGKGTEYEDIGNVPQRVERTYGGLLSAFEKNPKLDASKVRKTLTRQTEKGRDFDIAYNRLTDGIDGPPLGDFDATIAARKAAGIDGGTPDSQTPYRKVLEGLRSSSVRKLPIDELVNLVETGPQIILPEKAQNRADGSSAIVLAGGGNNTNVIPTIGATIGGPSLTDQLATKMTVDNALDDARQIVQSQPGTQVSQNRFTRTILPRSGPEEPTKQLNLFNPQGDVIGPGETQKEFIDRKFSVSAAESGDTTPEVSGTTIDPNRFPGGTMKERLANLRTENYEALLSGNTTPAIKQAINATGRSVRNGLVYKTNPRLAERDAEIITTAQLEGKDFSGKEIYFGSGVTKVKQNVKLGAQFPEILEDPTRETVIFQGKERPRTDFETPVATTASQQRYDDKVQKQLDYREQEITDADERFSNMRSEVESTVNKLQEGQQNIKNIVASLPERTDLNPRQKQQTAKRLGQTSELIKNRVSQQRKKFEDASDYFQSRTKGIMETTQEKIDNIPVEKTIKSQQGELYELRETKDPDTGKVTQNIVPAFTRSRDSKQEFDTGVGLEKQEIETGGFRGSQLEDTDSRRKLLDINELKGRGPEADQIRADLIESASKQVDPDTGKVGIDLFDISTEGRQKTANFLSNRRIVSNPENVGERMVGTPGGIAGEISKIYRTGNPATVDQRVKEFTDRLRKQQGG